MNTKKFTVKKTQKEKMAQQNKTFPYQRNFNNNNKSSEFPSSYKRNNNFGKNNYTENNHACNKPMYVQPKISTHKGCHHEVNFGKYKSAPNEEEETWYDLANKGEFNYIQWCLNTDKIDLHATTKPHAQTAMLTQYDPKAKWNKIVSRSSTEQNVQLVSYNAKIDGEEVTGPEIREVECKDCKRFRNVDHYVISHEVCNDCVKNYSNFNT
jgi:hypothetical protein